jgi:DNA-binding SARP family transcriptional activator
MENKLEILLLGPPIVRWEGELIPIPRRLSRMLLFYLAWQGTMVSRETVLDLFWESDIQKARRRLAETISRLRAALPVKDVILSYDKLIGVDLDQVYVDRLHFVQLLDQAGPIPWTTPEDEPLPADIHQLLVQANALWRKECTLHGISAPSPALDNWMRQSASKVHGLRFNVLTRLAQHALVMSDFQDALAFARTAHIYEPYNEDIHLIILKSLVNLGRTSEALECFERTRKILLDELGINPSPQLTRLYQEIQQENTSLPTVQPRWEIHPSAAVPFVGRENDLREISRIVERQQAVILVGESGQGKSRLIQEFISRLSLQPRVLLTVCRPLERTLPFHPLVELLRRYVTPDEWLSLSPVWASRIVGLLPELAQMRDDIQLLSLFDGVEQAQTMIFESIRQVFLLMSEQRPLFLVIDDAQWADKSTLGAVAYLLAREPFSERSSMVLIARQEDITTSLQEKLRSLQESKHAVLYTLGSLTPSDIRSIAYHILREQPSETFINHLLADTGGNTFFVLEILQAIGESDEIDVQSLDASLPLTENLQNLILARIHKISPEARATLEIAALIGAEFSIPILEKSCQTNMDALLPILNELENNLLIAPGEQRRGELFYRFVHDKIRETLISRIPAPRAQILHGQIVQAIEKKPQHAAILAHHYSGTGDWVAAFHYWIEAAERARSLFASEDADQAYAMAESVLEKIVTELSDEEIYRFYADWNDLAYNVTDTDLLKHIGHTLIHLGEHRQSPLLIGSGLDALSDACMTENDFETGLEYATQAIARLETAGNSFELIEAYNHRGTFLYMLNHLEEALHSFQDALALGTDTDDSKIYKARSNAHYQIALLQVLFAKPSTSYTHGKKALEFAELERHSYSIAQAYAIQSLAQFYLGEFTPARVNALKGIELAEHIQGWRMLGYLYSYAAISEVALGRLDSAYDHAQSAIQIGEQYEHFDIAALGCRSLGEMYRLLLDYPRAAHYYQKGYARLREQFLGLDNLYRLGLTRYYMGEPDGIEQIDFTLSIIEQTSLTNGAIVARLCRALVTADQGQWDETQKIAESLEMETRLNKMNSHHTNALCLLGDVALASDNYDAALEYYTLAVDEAQFTQNIWLELKAQTGIKNVLQQQGKSVSAQQRRIEILLNQLNRRVRHPEIRPSFERFRTQIADSTRIVTDTL